MCAYLGHNNAIGLEFTLLPRIPIARLWRAGIGFIAFL